MYPVSDMKRYLAYTVKVPCNWKVIQDNFNESYHLRSVHPQASGIIEEGYKDTQFDMCAEGIKEAVDTPAGPVARDADVQHEVLNYGDKSIGMAMDQDLSITTGQQLGFRSRGYRGVYLSGQEARVRRYHEVIDEYIQGARPHGRLNAKSADVKPITR